MMEPTRLKDSGDGADTTTTGQGDWRGENPTVFYGKKPVFDRHIIINHHKSWMFMVHVKNRYANKNRG
jgi:hypothetical protein